MFSSHVAPSQVAPCAWHRGRRLRSASCQQASHLQREDGLSYNACQQHPTPCLSQPNSTRYSAPPALLQNTAMCFACMRTNEGTNVGGKKRRNQGLFSPPFPVVFEKLEAADDERVVFLPSLCALCLLLLLLHLGTERVETPGSRRVEGEKHLD